MKKSRILFVILAGALALPGGTWGVRTTVWEVSGREAVEKGEPDRVTIGPLGTLELSPAFEPYGTVEEFYVWSIVADREGNLYAGTGDQGKVYRIDRSGKARLLFDSLELDVLSLALDGEGNLYAGTSPDGIIFRIDDEGNGRPFFDSPDHYIWDLVFDGDGNLYAATGEHGKIYKVDRSGEAEVFYDSPEKNILCLQYDGASKRLLAGGDGEGLVLSIDEGGKASVLFDSPRTEVPALLLARDGSLYAAASGKEGAGKGNESEKKPKALLYRIEQNGTVVLHWRADAEFIYALVEEEGGTILAGTGGPGSLVRVSPAGDGTVLRRLTESQVLSLHVAGDRIYASTGNQGRIYRIGPERAEEGTYESEVEDVMNHARWGILRWWGSEPAGTEVRFSTRSGNTENPDETWGEWAEIGEGAREGAVRSAPARFLQWRAELRARQEKSPVVGRVTVAHKESNLPPRVLDVSVTRVGETFFEGPADPRPEPLHQVLSDGTRVEYMPMEPDHFAPPPAAAPWAHTVRIVRWHASDPNGDDLLSDVYYRAEGEKEWKLAGEEVRQDYFAIDTRFLPDGLYRVRVVAGDEDSNTEATALEGEKTSDPFTVDNTAPEVARLEAHRDGDRVRVRGEARDGASPIERAEYSLDAREWRPVDPVDEIFDGTRESFDFSVEAPEGEEQVLMLRVLDQAGNAIIGKAVVR